MKTLLIDGNNSLWRIAKVLPALRGSGESPIQVVYGFLRLLRSTVSDFEPDRVLVCWDKGVPKERQKLYPGYKAHRFEKKRSNPIEKKIEYADVERQKSVIGDLLSLLCVGQVAIQNLEADDLIGIACNVLLGGKIIISADQDMLQLVRSDVSVWSPIKHELYNAKNFFRKIGLTPRQFLEMRVLVGDSSDGIPGAARGFGPTTAKELLLKYGSIDTLLKKNVQKKVEGRGNRYCLLYSEGSEERIGLNLRLMDLSFVQNKEAVKAISSEASKERKLDKLAVRAFFKKNEFQSLLNDFSTWLQPFEGLAQERE